MKRLRIQEFRISFSFKQTEFTNVVMKYENMSTVSLIFDNIFLISNA